MQNIKKIVFGLLVLLSSTEILANAKITICTDTNFWYPFTFVKNHEAMGLHIDIISTALRKIGLEPVFKPASWQQCLMDAKNGTVDAIATASYRDDRATYLNYPAGAATDRKSPWRVTQVEYVVITSAVNPKGEKNDYQFTGDVKSIPQPIRVPAYYSVAQDLRNEGLTVKEGKNSIDDFKKLVKDRTGSVVALEEIAEHLATQPEFSEKFIVQRRPLNLKSYYLAFSKGGSVKSEEAQRIWQAIANVREDQKVMGEFLIKY